MTTNSRQTRCLSIRQPWAWLIVNGWKDIENRTWPTSFRGHLLIHASKMMTHDDLSACKIFLSGISGGWDLIGLIGDGKSLQRGGIIGEAVISDCVTHHESKWFCGPYGFVLGEQHPLPFRPCRGALKFFYAEHKE